MIAVSSSGTGFKALATYLVHGRTGREAGRVAWTSARNLPTAEPALAATLMRATAAQNLRVEQPVYHLALAFDPGDPVDRAAMERVADRLLDRLGLAGHQVLIAAHQDRAHPHLHLLVNRVHPDTGRVWDRWQDMPAIQAVLRAEEHALGFRAVPGHLHVRDAALGVERETAAGASRAPVPAVPPARAVAEPPLLDIVSRARAALPAVRAAGSWDDLAQALDDAGLRVERRRSGLVVTDGARYAKASRVAPDFGLRRLEQRLGAYPIDQASAEAGGPARVALAVPVPPFAPALPTAERAPLGAIARDVAAWEDARALGADLRTATDAVHAARAALASLDRAIDRTTRTAQAVETAFATVYVDAARAHRAFLAAVARDGADRAVDRLGAVPEAFGPLHTVARTRAFGVGRIADGAAARQMARAAQGMASEWIAARQQLVALIGGPRGDGRDVHVGSLGWMAAARTARADTLDAATTAARAAAARQHGRPTASAIEQGLRESIRRLTPAELQQLAALLTRPQVALVQRVRQAVRDTILGRDVAD